MVSRFDDLRATAPDLVSAWDGIEAERFLTVRREVRKRAGPGTAPVVVAQLGATAAALVDVVVALPAHAFALPGGEEDWTVGQAIGHTADARSGLALAASLAAQGRFPADAPAVVPGIPGLPGAAREDLIGRLQRSQRLMERAARSIAGHETDTCPLVHPWVGRLRCGEWLLFAGVHDLMHLEQVEALAAALGVAAGGWRRARGPPVTIRPDLVATWVVRVPDPARPADMELLLLRRAPGRPLPGLWQCVTGRLESGERITLAALRELQEETGIGTDMIEAFYDLDLVSQFHWSTLDAVLSEVMFAVRVRPGVGPVLSHEHDDARWVSPDDAVAMTVWPAYREAIDRIRTILPDPERRRWFETSLQGDRLA